MRKMSNYPPGVTGNEPQIAGTIPHAEEHECDEELAEYMPIPVVRETIDRLNDLLSRIDGSSNPIVRQRLVQQGRYALTELREASHAEMMQAPCEWKGQVDVEYADRYGTGSWVCPRCGTEHEVEAPDDPRDDPDYLREIAREGL